MGCKQSTPLKEETIATTTATPVVVAPQPVAVTAPVKVEASPEKAATPRAEEKEEELEEKAQEPEVVITPIEPVKADEPAHASEPAVIEEPVEAKKEEIIEEATKEEVIVAAPIVTAPVEEETAKKKKIVRKVKKVPKVTAANDENTPAMMMTSPVKTFAPVTAIKAAAKAEQVAPKRVAFAARTTNNVPVASGKAAAAPKVASTNKNRKHKNVEQKKVQEMTMAFQRLLTHADHLDAHLSTRNTYTNQA